MDEPNPTQPQIPAAPGLDAIPSQEAPQSLAANHLAGPPAPVPAPATVNLHDRPVTWSGPSSTSSPGGHGVITEGASNWIIDGANTPREQHPEELPKPKPQLPPPPVAPPPQAQPAASKRKTKRKRKPPAPTLKKSPAKKKSPLPKGKPGARKVGGWSRYRIHLRGTFAKHGERVAIVSDGIQSFTIDLKLNQFLTLLILASFARCEADLDAPIEVRGGGGEYLQPDRINEVFDELKDRYGELEGRAENLITQDVYHAYYGARKRFKKRKLLRLLRSRSRRGYWLMVKPHWIKITLFGKKGSRTWEGNRKVQRGDRKPPSEPEQPEK